METTGYMNVTLSVKPGSIKTMLYYMILFPKNSLHINYK